MYKGQGSEETRAQLHDSTAFRSLDLNGSCSLASSKVRRGWWWIREWCRWRGTGMRCCRSEIAGKRVLRGSVLG
jgi:hypothetical protein